MTLLGQHFSFFLAVYPRSSHVCGCLSIPGLCCQDTDVAVVYEGTGIPQPPSSDLTRALTAFVGVGYGSFSWLLQNKQLYKL